MHPRFFAAVEGVMTRTRSVPSAITVVVLFGLLAGCGPMPEPTPTTSPQITPPVEEGAATPETPPSAELTLGELAERVNDAWPTVRSYRITFTGSTLVMPAGLGTPVARPLATPGATLIATPGATPVARPRETFVSIREVVLPDRPRDGSRRARWPRVQRLWRRGHCPGDWDAGRLHHRRRRPRHPLLHRNRRRWRDSGSRRVQRHRRPVDHRATHRGDACERSARVGHTV